MAPLTNIEYKEYFYDLHQETFLEYSGHLSTGGNPAASTSVGMMSTNSTILSVTLVENGFDQSEMVDNYLGFITLGATPGTLSMKGARCAISKLVCLSHSACSPS